MRAKRSLMEHLPMLSMTGLAVVAMLLSCMYASSTAWGLAMTESTCKRCHGTDDAAIVAFHHGVRDANNWSCTQCHKPVSDGTGGYTIAVEQNCAVCHGPGYHTDPAGTNAKRHHAIRNANDYGCLHCHPAVLDDSGGYTIVVSRDCFFCHADGQKQWRAVKYLTDLPTATSPDTAAVSTDITSKFHDTMMYESFEIADTTSTDKALSVKLDKDAALASKVTLGFYVFEQPTSLTTIRIYPYLFDGVTVDTSMWKDFRVSSSGWVQCDVTAVAAKMSGFTWMKFRVVAMGNPLLLSEGSFEILRKTTDVGTNQIPIPNAGPDKIAVVGETIDFSGAGSTDAEGGIVSYDWNFGDGTTGSGFFTSHVYTVGGVYLVSLTVTDNMGAVAEDFAFVHVKTESLPPNKPPIANAGPDIVATAGKAITLSGAASSDADGQVASYTWSFDDGTSSAGATVSKIFHNTGIYTVSLTITDNQGAVATDTLIVTVLAPPGGNAVPVANAGDDTYASVGETVTFSGASSYDLDGTINSYVWNFGDGTKATGVSPRKIFSTAGVYVVTLVVTDNGGAQSSDTVTITIHSIIKQNQPPLADSAPVQATATVGQPITLTAAGSLDSDGTIASYSWNFGDGTTATGITATKTYQAAGIFTVTLTATDNGGATGMATSVVTVNETENVPPTANAGSDVSAAPGDSLTFSGTGSSDSDGSITSYSWNFGDGTTATGITANKVYTVDGTYTVTLTVTDNAGASATDTAVVLVYNSPPVANAGADAAAATGQVITFSGAGSSDADGSIASYAWSFGDGTSATGVTATKTYVVTGTYTVKLTVTDNAGATAVDTAVVTVAGSGAGVAPIANAGPDVTGRAGQSISFACTGSSDPDGSIVSYVWAFGDGSTKSGCNVTKNYTAAGNYTVTLTVTDNSGAKGTDTAVATINPRTRK